MRNHFIAFLVAAASSLYGQIICKGILLDSASGKPVEYANIGLTGKGVGTVSDENGHFHLPVPDSLRNETVRISMIGYKSRTVTVKQLSGSGRLYLEPEVTALNEVSVTAKKLKIKTAGNVTTHSGITGGFYKNSLGAELAVKLDIKNPNTQIRTFRINIVRNSLEKAVFRLNLYSKDKDGRPGENILKQNIIIEPEQKTGLIEVDLKPYNIVVSDDVFIALEWIKDLGDVKGLYFSTKLMGQGTWFRRASQDKWERAGAVGVGLHAEIGY